VTAVGVVADPSEEPATMWTYTVAAPRRLAAGRVAAPSADTLAPGQVLVRTHAGGICGSDIPFFRGRLSPVYEPLNAGGAALPGFSLHEIAGEVIASADDDLRPGDRVVGWADGSDALARDAVTSASSVVRHQPGLSAVEAVVLQPLACVLSTLERVGDLRGAHVAVVGLGPIGLLFCHAAAAAGAAKVTGVDPVDRAAVAPTYGIGELMTLTSDRWVRSLGETDRPDVVVEVVGHQVGTAVDAIEAVAPGGRVFLFGVPDDVVYPLPFYTAFRKGLHLMTGAVPDRRRALEQSDTYARAHPEVLGALVSDTFAVGDAQRAYERAELTAPDRLKVVLDLGA
jgi:L-iditol 2-dehydrogenase